MKRNILVFSGIIGTICLGLFLAWDIKTANEAKRIGAYNNPDVAAVRTALARNPNDAAAISSMAFSDIGHSNWAGALPEFQQLVRLEPSNREARFMLAHAQMRTEHQAEARQSFQELALQNDLWGRAAKRNLGKLNGKSNIIGW